MNAHTPGPWRAGKAGTGGGAVVADTPIPEMGGSDDVAYYGGHLVAESIAHRNVPLIATAPDLLDALKALHNNVEELSGFWNESTSNFMQMAEAAIAKAEGRS